MGTPLSATEARWFNRERLLLGAILLAVIVGAAVVTSLLVSPDEAQPAALSPRVVDLGKQVKAPPARAAVGTLDISSRPNGASLRIDGRWLPQTTPAQVEVPANRKVAVRVQLDENYEPHDTEVTLAPGQILRLQPELRRIVGRLMVETRPSGATVSVNGREMPGRSPLTVDALPIDRSSRVLVTKPGFRPRQETVGWESGREQRLVLELEPEVLEVAPAPRAVSPRRAPRRTAHRRRRPEPRRREARYEPPRREPRRPEPRRPEPRRPEPRPAAPRARTHARSGVGYLSVTARRWGSVYVDGNRVSMETPLLKYRVQAGEHEVYVAYGGDAGRRSAPRQVTITRGATQLVKF